MRKRVSKTPSGRPRIWRQEIIRSLALSTGIGERAARQAVTVFLELLVRALENGDEPTFNEFGTFFLKRRKGRNRPPQILHTPHGRINRIPDYMRETLYVKFKAHPTLRARILTGFYERRKTGTEPPIPITNNAKDIARLKEYRRVTASSQSRTPECSPAPSSAR